MGNQKRYTTTINSKPLYHIQGNIIMYMCDFFLYYLCVSRPWRNTRERAILLVLENGRYVFIFFFWQCA